MLPVNISAQYYLIFSILYFAVKAKDNNLVQFEERPFTWKIERPEVNDQPSLCHLPAHEGFCHGSNDRYHYDPQANTCEKFVYTGCAGNKNNFKSQLECEKTCVIKEDNEADIITDRPNFCYLPAHVGYCHGYNDRYHYDPKTKTCESFVYTGCAGNKNNFKTQSECETTCKVKVASVTATVPASVPASVESVPVTGTNDNNNKKKIVCAFARQKGLCGKKLIRYYYDINTDRCKPFTYGGCFGNGNNFKTYTNCEKHCKGYRQLDIWTIDNK